MIASLPMYDMPHARAAHDRFWQAIAAQLPGAPTALTRDGDVWQMWQSDELLLSQTCGLPYRARLHDKVALVGTPDYGLPGCPPGYYNSVIVTRPGQTPDRTRTLAYNEALSQSGWAAARSAGLGDGPLVQTGGHAASAAAVAEERADVATLDALTWELLQVEHPDLCARLEVHARTEPTPGLPYITAPHRDPAPIAAAIDTAIADLPDTDRSVLRLRGLTRIPKEDYRAVPIPDAPRS